MKERIAQITTAKDAQHLYMGTFHSIFARILRREGEAIGFGSNFTIYDENDSRSLIKSIVKALDLDEKTYKPAAVHNFISMAKNHLITAAEYAEDRAAIERDRSARMPAIHMIYKAYEADVVRQMQWTLMIFCFIPSYFFVTIKLFVKSMVNNLSISLLMSIKIQITHR